jgi:hypothetical protein
MRVAHVLAILATGATGLLAVGSARAGEPSPARPVALPGTPGTSGTTGVRVVSPSLESSPSPSPSPGTATTSGQAGSPIYPLPARAAYPEPCPPPYKRVKPPGRRIEPTPKVAERQVPAPVAVDRTRVADLTAIRGTGIWVTVFKGETIDARAIVARSSGARMTSIWIRTGGTYNGFYGAAVLPELLTLAHAKGMKVIAWDFPTLSDPVADAARMVRTLRYSSPTGERVDGVSPDVESRSEGVFLTPRRMQAYLSRITAAADSRPVILTAYRPTDHWWGSNGANGAYPYVQSKPYVDAFAPMIYWSCNEPGAVTRQAVDRLKTLRPVHTIGQQYDMGAEGSLGRPGLPTALETWRFLDVSQRRGAVGGSLYLYSQMRGPNWRAMWGFDGWR